MSIEAAIVTRMRADETVAALIEDRIYPMYLPQGETRAAVTYQQVSGVDGTTTDGALGLVDSRWQFTCWSSSHPTCLALMEAVRALWSFFAGTVAGVTIQGTQVLDRGDVPALNDQAEALTRYGKYLDVQISYEE